jgi:hypothetical protein
MIFFNYHIRGKHEGLELKMKFLEKELELNLLTGLEEKQLQCKKQG